MKYKQLWYQIVIFGWLFFYSDFFSLVATDQNNTRQLSIGNNLDFRFRQREYWLQNRLYRCTFIKQVVPTAFKNPERQPINETCL